ncbi:MAG: glycosyltransferase family 2 protein [Gammaproteobacteria bacterium]|nr:glycosyltransferase family 2 protein [Gammaproteobacteria bacterium]
MLFGNHITVVIPALNEAASIGKVVSAIPRFVDQVVVVDNGSTDPTARVASAQGASVVYESNRGYGSACLTGIVAAGQTDLIAFVDGDYSDYPEDLEKVITPVARNDCDFVIGCRSETGLQNHDLPWHQHWGNWFACCMIHWLHGFKYHDLGPMRCIKAGLLSQLKMCDTTYGWTTEMQIKASKLGVNVSQVPVRYRRRIGKSKISGTLKGSVFAGYKILYWTLRLWGHDGRNFNSR